MNSLLFAQIYCASTPDPSFVLKSKMNGGRYSLSLFCACPWCDDRILRGPMSAIPSRMNDCDISYPQFVASTEMEAAMNITAR